MKKIVLLDRKSSTWFIWRQIIDSVLKSCFFQVPKLKFHTYCVCRFKEDFTCSYQPLVVLTEFMWTASLLSHRWPDSICLVMSNHSLSILKWDCAKSVWLVSIMEEQNRDWLNNCFFKKQVSPGNLVVPVNHKWELFRKWLEKKLLTYIFLPLEWKQE